MTSTRASVALASLWLVLLFAAAPAAATAYRCEADGRITYSDQPCPTGRQSALADRAAPTAQDRAAALGRHSNDRAALAEIDEARAREQRQDARAAALAARREAGRGKEAAACDKLALRAKRAHEDYERAGPRDQATLRTRMHRADDDQAARCRRSGAH